MKSSNTKIPSKIYYQIIESRKFGIGYSGPRSPEARRRFMRLAVFWETKG